MTTSIELREIELENLEKATGHIAIFIGMDGTLDKVARRMNRLTKGAVDRVAHSDAFEKLAQGDAIALAYPAGLAAQSLEIVKLDRRADALTARKAGVGLAKRRNGQNLLVLAGLLKQAAELTNGIALRDYRFDTYRTQSEQPTMAKSRLWSIVLTIAATVSMMFWRCVMVCISPVI
jgi:leucyl aminopeptidase